MQMCTVDKGRRFMTTDRSALSSERALPDTFFMTQTAGHQDRLTDRLTVNRNVTVTEPIPLYLYWVGSGRAESERESGPCSDRQLALVAVRDTANTVPVSHDACCLPNGR